MKIVPLRNTTPIIAIGSGKGGVGKTWFAISLAHALATSGKRVLLVDCDLGLANVDVQLGLAARHDLTSVVAGKVPLEDAINPALGGPGAKGGFDVIAGRSGSGSLADLSADAASKLMAGVVALAMYYEVVLLDLGAGVSASIMKLAALADRQIVVATEEPTSLTDSYAFLKLLYGRADRARPAIVVNQAEGKREADATYEALAQACQSFLGVRPDSLGFIPRDLKVRDAIRAQVPIRTRSPQCPANLAVEKLAREMLGAQPVPENGISRLIKQRR